MSHSDTGICVRNGASATPAASNPSYTSGSHCRRSSRHLAITIWGCMTCGAVGRNADVAADSASGAGSSRSRSSTITSCPARASISEANDPAAPLPMTAILMPSPPVSSRLLLRSLAPPGTGKALCARPSNHAVDDYQQLVTTHPARPAVSGKPWYPRAGVRTAHSWERFARSRDKGLPGHQLLSRVPKATRGPTWATVLAAVIGAIITLVLRTHAAALATLFTASTIMPALLYAATVILYVVVGRRRREQGAHFSLGRWEIPVIAGALIWLVYELIILIGPSQFRDAQYYVLGSLGLGLIVYAIGWLLEPPADRLASLTGLRLDPYFAAPKIAWLRENVTTAMPPGSPRTRSTGRSSATASGSPAARSGTR